MKTIKKYYPLFIAGIAIALYFYYRYEKSSELDKSSIISVARVDKIIRVRYTYSEFRYEFYYKGKRYTSQRGLGNIEPNTIFNNFYEIEFSQMNPKNNKIYLDLEVKDSLRISNAGFSKND